jgi:hypothetical protein
MPGHTEEAQSRLLSELGCTGEQFHCHKMDNVENIFTQKTETIYFLAKMCLVRYFSGRGTFTLGGDEAPRDNGKM